MSSHWITFTTTVLRGSTQELTGYLISIDWSSKKVIKKIPIPLDTRHPCWNARGGNRGGRGIQFDKRAGILYVGTATEILKYTADLEFLGAINHRYMAGLHEILLDEQSIWITSTVHDLIFQIDFEGRILDQWWGSQSRYFQTYFDFQDRQLNTQLDFPTERFVEEYEKYCDTEIFHINALSKVGDALFTLSSSKKAILQIRPEEKTILVDPELINPHNLSLIGDQEMVLNDTGNQRLQIYNLQTGERTKTLDIQQTAITERSVQFAKPGWQRGLAQLDADTYLIGTSPAQILEVDTAKSSVKHRMVLDKDVRHCIHGLLAVDL